MNKAVFLDRDGVINQERGDYTFRKEDFIILPEIIESLAILESKGYALIVISNQSGIGKGVYTQQDVFELDKILREKMNEKKINITHFYFCPHHPDFTGKCLCRKPESVLFEKAIARFAIDPTKSFMIGDKERDILPAKKLGIRTFLIASNESVKNIVSLIP